MTAPYRNNVYFLKPWFWMVF